MAVLEPYLSFVQNFYRQCLGDGVLEMIKDSTPVDRNKLNPNKVFKTRYTAKFIY